MTLFVSVLTLTVVFLAVPHAYGTMLDLTTHDASGYIGGAYFLQTDGQSTGSGVIDSFVRLNTNHDVSEGYNTTANGVFDTGSSDTFDHELLLADIPVVVFGGIRYREFLLDINEPNGNKGTLSLDEIQIFRSNVANQNVESFNSGIVGLTSASLVYRLDTANNDNWIALNANLNHGSGSGDMFAYIPDSFFSSSTGDYVYLYSRFGENYANNAGFEEWSVLQHENIVPEPATFTLLGIGLAGMLLITKSKRAQ